MKTGRQKVMSDKLKVILLERGLTQRMLSSELGVHYGVVNMQVGMRRTMSKKYIDEFCKILRLNVNALRRGNIRRVR